MSIIIGLSGEIASGKTTIAYFLRNKHGFEYLRYSLLMKELLEEQTQPVNDATLLAIGQKLEEELGGRGVSDLLMRNYDPSSNYVVDGLRHLSDYEYFRERFTDRFYLVYIDVPEQIRMERFKRRVNKRDASEKTFIERSQHLMEQEVPLLKQKASVVISNDTFITLESATNLLVYSWLSNSGFSLLSVHETSKSNGS